MKIKIPLPEKAKVKVKEGKELKFSDILFTAKSESTIEINVAKELGIKPEKIYNHLKKLIDDPITPDEVIAEKKGFFSSKKIKSPVEGRIIEIDHIKGIIKIETEEDEKFTFSGVKGKVTKVNDKSIEIELKNAQEFKLDNTSLTKPCGKELFFITQPDMIKRLNVEKKAVVIEKINGYLEAKLKALGTYLIISLFTPKEFPNYLKISNLDDFKKLINSGKKYILILPAEKKFYVYN